MKPLSVHPIQTPIFHIGGNLIDFITAAVPQDLIAEKMVLAVTSKIISVAEKRFARRDAIEKPDLVRRESDVYMGAIGHGCYLTIKEGLLIASAGIDESNSESGDYILYPENPYESAGRIWSELRSRWGLKELGVVVTDSHTSPLRRGVTGVCLSYRGFRGVRSLVDTPDLFDRNLRMTQINYADGLAAAAVMMMGEGAECQPLAVIANAPVDFSEESRPEEVMIPLDEDLYAPFLRAFLEREEQ